MAQHGIGKLSIAAEVSVAKEASKQQGDVRTPDALICPRGSTYAHCIHTCFKAVSMSLGSLCNMLIPLMCVCWRIS